jgi:acyl-CoA synthetase (NDP forming)
VPSYRFPESAARARARAAERSAWLREPRARPAASTTPTSPRTCGRAAALACHGPGWLSPSENEELLAAFGIPRARSIDCASAAEAAAAATQIGGPVAVKLASRTLVHKSDWDAVHLDVGTPADAANAFVAIERRLAAAGKRDEMLGVTVAPMARGGVDTIVGMVADPDFGPLVAFGLGGVATEILGDVAFRLAPITDQEALRMVRSIRGRALLAGHRGAPPADEAGGRGGRAAGRAPRPRGAGGARARPQSGAGLRAGFRRLCARRPDPRSVTRTR